MWLVGGGCPIPEGLTSAREECAGGGGQGRAERVGAGPQPEAQGSWWPRPQPLHLSSDMALRREGEQARKGGADLSKKVGRGSSGSMEARLGAGGEYLHRPFPGRFPRGGWLSVREVKPWLGSLPAHFPPPPAPHA